MLTLKYKINFLPVLVSLTYWVYVVCLGVDKLNRTICPLHDPVAWYKMTHACEQVAQWDFQNDATRTSQLGPAFVLEVPLRSLLTSMCDFVPCDRTKGPIVLFTVILKCPECS